MQISNAAATRPAHCAALAPGLGGLLAQVQHFADQRVDLGLLADHDLVKFVEQIFGKTGFDFKLRQALRGV
jgi:hypothetical protein